MSLALLHTSCSHLPQCVFEYAPSVMRRLVIQTLFRLSHPLVSTSLASLHTVTSSSTMTGEVLVTHASQHVTLALRHQFQAVLNSVCKVREQVTHTHMRNRCTQRDSRVTLTKYNVCVGQTRAKIRSQLWISRPTRSKSAGLHLQMVLPLPTHCHPTPPLIPPTFPHHAAPVREQPPRPNPSHPVLCDLTNRLPCNCSSAWHPGGASPRHSGRDTAASCASQPPSAEQPPACPQRCRCHHPWPKGWPAARLGASRSGWAWYEMDERMPHHEPPIALLTAPALPPTEESFLLMAGCKASYTVPKGGSVYVGVAVAPSIRYSIFTDCVALSVPTQVLCGQATRATGRHTVGARLYLQPHGAHASHHRW